MKRIKILSNKKSKCYFLQIIGLITYLEKPFSFSFFIFISPEDNLIWKTWKVGADQYCPERLVFPTQAEHLTYWGNQRALWLAPLSPADLRELHDTPRMATIFAERQSKVSICWPSAFYWRNWSVQFMQRSLLISVCPHTATQLTDFLPLVSES